MSSGRCGGVDTGRDAARRRTPMPSIFGIDDDPSIRMLVTNVLGLEECDV